MLSSSAQPRLYRLRPGCTKLPPPLICTADLALWCKPLKKGEPDGWPPFSLPPKATIPTVVQAPDDSLHAHRNPVGNRLASRFPGSGRWNASANPCLPPHGAEWRGRPSYAKAAGLDVESFRFVKIAYIENRKVLQFPRPPTLTSPHSPPAPHFAQARRGDARRRTKKTAVVTTPADP